MQEKVIANKYGGNLYLVSAVMCIVMAAAVLLLGVLMQRGLMTVFFIVVAVSFGVFGGFSLRKGLRIRKLPQHLIVLRGGTLCIHAKEGYTEISPQKISSVKEVSRFNGRNTYDYGELCIVLQGGRTLHVEYAGDLAKVKQRLTECRALTEKKDG